MRLALLTFGLLRARPGDPTVQGFVDLTDPTFAQAEASDGVLGRGTTSSTATAAALTPSA
jgi:hypothetical protein